MKNGLITKISQLGQLLKFSEILFGLMFWLMAVSSIWLMMFLIDNMLALPSGLRLPMAIAGTAFMSIMFFKRIFIPANRKRSIERTAVALEDKFNIKNNILINSCQLSQREFTGESKKFVDVTIKSSESVITDRKFFESEDVRKITKWAIGVTAALILWVVYIFMFPNFAVNALNRYIEPMKDVPPASSIKMTIFPGNDIKLLEGDTLKINCRFDSAKNDPNEQTKLSADLNPRLIWKSGKEYVPPVQSEGQLVNMKPSPKSVSSFEHRFSNIKRTFSFRVFGAGTYSRSTKVTVIPRPKIIKSLFEIRTPAYTGGKRMITPGPPSLLSCLPESNIKIKIELDNPVDSMFWQVGKSQASFKGNGKVWSLEGLVSSPGLYHVKITEKGSEKTVQLSDGAVSIIKDEVPEIEFLTKDRNRLVNPGTDLELNIQGVDDYGIKSISVTCRTINQQVKDARVLKRWDYLGPPGKTGPITESFKTVLDSSNFPPGNTYLFQTVCQDFSPRQNVGSSKPLIIRIKSIEEVNISRSDPLANAVDLLKSTIKQQKKANGIANNIKIHLDEILKKKHIDNHAAAILKQQNFALNEGTKTIAEFKKFPTGKPYVQTLTSLVNGEMKLVLNDINELKQVKRSKANIASITKRQKYILRELVLLLGNVIEDSKANSEAKKKTEESDAEAEEDEGLAQDLAKSIKNDLENYVKDQNKILEISKKLRDKNPEDLTDKEEEIIGALAREQSKWAKLFEEKLTDFSKLPGQDFSDSSIAQEFNEVYQEVKLAAKSLYEKKMDIAVPLEQSGIESAEKLVHNLEKWLPDTPDYQKWSMEDPKTPLDIPLAELPDEMEDIIGELMDNEEEMTEDVEDVTSQWMDSLDKGAGWDAADGPISNMSAKGVTGNRLPNQNEVGGRSGEGRSGRSHGQMVEATADGKGGRQTPTRLTPSPFESGSVKDKSKEATGGATGGGKLSGFTGEGLRGPTPPKMKQTMARLAGNQSKIRQQAERMAVKLTAHNLPSGDLESAIIQMKDFEKAAKQGNAQGIRKSYNRIMDYLKQSDASMKTSSRLRREKIKLPKHAQNDIMKSLREGIPKGYETMIGEYFKALAGEKN